MEELKVWIDELAEITPWQMAILEEHHRRHLTETRMSAKALLAVDAAITSLLPKTSAQPGSSLTRFQSLPRHGRRLSTPASVSVMTMDDSSCTRR